VKAGVSVEATVFLNTLISMEAPMSPFAQEEPVRLSLGTLCAWMGARLPKCLETVSSKPDDSFGPWIIQHKDIPEWLFLGFI
jgi:hypothetical protein